MTLPESGGGASAPWLVRLCVWNSYDHGYQPWLFQTTVVVGLQQLCLNKQKVRSAIWATAGLLVYILFSGGFRLGPGGHRPPQILPRPPQIFDWFLSALFLL